MRGKFFLTMIESNMNCWKIIKLFEEFLSSGFEKGLLEFSLRYSLSFYQGLLWNQ